MGSKSFAAAMLAQTQERGGQRPHIADFYKSSHYNEKKNKWVDTICEQLHVSILTEVTSPHFIFYFMQYIDSIFSLLLLGTT
jgi:hypothetical protein